MLSATTVYCYSQTVPLYSATDDAPTLTVWLSECSEIQVTPSGLLNYIVKKYSINIPSNNTTLALFELYDLCCKKRTGTRVAIYQITPSKVCEEQELPNYLGQAWALDFVCGKEILYQTGEGELQLLKRYTNLIDPINGTAYTHIQSSFMNIVNTGGFTENYHQCVNKQRTGFSKVCESIAFRVIDGVRSIALNGTHSLVFTN